MKHLQTDPILYEVIRRLSESLPAKRIFLFGSRAIGNMQEDSDYDFLILVDDNKKEQIAHLIDKGHRSLKGVKAFTDLVVMTERQFQQQVNVINSLPEIINNEGIELYAS